MKLDFVGSDKCRYGRLAAMQFLHCKFCHKKWFELVRLCLGVPLLGSQATVK